MIKYHPDHNQLLQFARGEAEPAWALLIAAHVDMCPHCQDELDSITEKLSEQLLPEASPATTEISFDSMMFDIMKLEPIKTETVIPEKHFLEWEGRQFELPRALRRVATKTESWTKLVGKLWQAPVDLGDMGKGHFIYMEKGGSVPEHTHRGNELTLVINGEFEDGHRCYDTGDFILMNQDNTHMPVSNHDDGCLVFSFVDQPLHFTSGLARLLNPFSHLFFK